MGLTPDTPVPLPKLNQAEVARLMDRVSKMSSDRLWETQGNVRVAVDFLARNVAQLGLHVFERTSDTDRRRNHDSNTARALSAPNPGMTGFELNQALVSSFALSSDAWLLTTQTAAGWQLRPLSTSAVSIASGNELDGDLIINYSGSSGRQQPIEQKNFIHFKGWTPGLEATGSSVVDSLRDVLSEQVAAAAFRKNMWSNAGQMGSYIQRPKDAPGWADGARTRFIEGLRAFKAGGAKTGGTLLLEDGMTITQNRFSAKEEQWLEAIQLSLEQVARAFHINPAMLGATGGISYANMKEFRSMLYSETLGPILKMVEDRINSFLIPRLDPDRDDLYVEFNVKAKLSASFEEQAAVLSAAVGRPWMTADEARALDNRPALGGDAELLVTPLNVLVGGQASPLDSAPKAVAEFSTKAAKPPMTGSVDAASEKLTKNALNRFFKRQSAAVLAKLGAKADADFWDADRWNRELSNDLFKVAMAVTGQVSAAALASIGEKPSAYNAGQTESFLKAVADSRAKKVNGATLAAIEAAIADPGADDDGAPVHTPEKVFEAASDSRGDTIAATLLTTFAGFAIAEAGKQLLGTSGGKASKTWRANSSNPRSEHAAMDGETVPVGDTFSNDAQWPGDPVLGADGVAGCECTLEINLP